MNQFLLFLQNLKEHGLEFYKKYYSVYPAVVVDNQDPELRGRVKVVCPSLFGPNFTLPQWVESEECKISGQDHGEFFPPYVGCYVNVLFEHGDTQLPMYRGGFFAKGELPSDFKSSYGNVRGWVFKDGQKILVDETSGATKITILNPDGTVISTASGGISIKMVDGTVAIGTEAVELLKQIGDILLKIGDFLGKTGAQHTHKGNLAVSTTPPEQAADYIQLQTDLATIRSMLKSITGSF